MTSLKEKRLIAVEDIIEIEHTEGHRFEIRYMEIKSSAKSVSGFGSQGPGQNKVAGAIGGILQKIKKKEGAKNGDPDNEIEK